MLTPKQFSFHILCPKQLDQCERLVRALAMVILPQFTNTTGTWDIANRVCDDYAIGRTATRRKVA